MNSSNVEYTLSHPSLAFTLFNAKPWPEFIGRIESGQSAIPTKAIDSSKSMVFSNSTSSLFHKQQWVKHQPSLQTRGKAQMFLRDTWKNNFSLYHTQLCFLLVNEMKMQILEEAYGF